MAQADRRTTRAPRVGQLQSRPHAAGDKAANALHWLIGVAESDGGLAVLPPRDVLAILRGMQRELFA